MKIGNGITSKITQLAWMVALSSLALFIVFNTSEQETDLQNGLSSKGQSVAIALSGEVASAAVSEDYTSVVEHAMEVVNGDKSVAFILIVKNDGYSMLVQRDGWQMIPAIDPTWYQRPRSVTGKIETVPLVNQRAFHYHHPLDCLGIPWGWIHIGLSLKDYDHSTRSIYLRALILGVICLLLSLVASILFARRLVQPIQKFRRTVESIAAGDLSARVELHAQDEIKQLGEAFNHMADAIVQRDRIVDSVRMAAQTLQRSDQWQAVGGDVIKGFALATDVSRAMLVHIELNPQNLPVTKILLEWAAEDIAQFKHAESTEAVNLPQAAKACERLMKSEILMDCRVDPKEIIFSNVGAPPIARLAAPIFADGKFWGSLVLHDCTRERNWKDVEKHSIRTIADMFGAAIQRQIAQQALLDAKSLLEQRVLERTAELSMQIIAKDQAHNELQSAQHRLIELSRISGMAEVATGVLHNVGNVLNSINVGATVIVDRLNGMKLSRLREVSEMMAAQKDDIGTFLRDDPRGQRIVPYLIKLAEQLTNERDSVGNEARSLVHHVAHVKEIVAMQQGYARNCGVLEKVSAPELMENAISISSPALERHGVEIIRVFEPMEDMTTDRHKVLQILLNLLQNAKDAVKAGGKMPRRIWVRLRKVGEDRICFEVEDNGIGIDNEHLVRIFSHGFTTKKSGHGFGLHSGALAAKEMGGTLNVFSDGLGCGATFTLELPVQATNTPEAGGTNEQRS